VSTPRVVRGLTGALRLAADVVLCPVEDLAAEVRRRLPPQDGGYAISRPRTRHGSRLLAADSADLLRQFEKPCTLVEAVLRHSRAYAVDPAATLDAAYALVERLASEGFLVAAGDGDGDGGPVVASWAVGDRVAGFEVLRCVHLVDDSEVYLVRDRPDSPSPRRQLALKIERRQAAAGTPSALPSAAAVRLEREAAILDHLAHLATLADLVPAHEAAAPRPVAAGLWQGRRFLALEWCPGVDALTAARELRETDVEGRPALLTLLLEVAEALARLHAYGVLHGDVHPRNVLVDVDGGVRWLDLGLAQWSAAPPDLPPVSRGGVAFYFEPEYAAARLAGRSAPASSAAGEQYALAVML
jgi:eukaryotic-like serine/threonine-protein kinase